MLIIKLKLYLLKHFYYLIIMENICDKLTINPDIHEVYGFLILSTQKYLIGTFFKGKKEILFKSDINLKGYRGRGGASAIRFKRIIEERYSKGFKTIEENMKNFFIKNNLSNISGLIIGGDIKVIKKYLSYKRNNELINLNEYLCTLIETINDGELGFEEAIKLSMLEN